MNPEDDVLYPSTFTPNYTDQAKNNKEQHRLLKLHLHTPLAT